MAYELIPGTGGRKFRRKPPGGQRLMTPCPLTAREGPYLLTCCLPAGHEGCCWCNNITTTVEQEN